MPKLWSATIEEHRRSVRDATLDAVGLLMAEHGGRAPTMSRIASAAGIGRATLYKYFPDVETVLLAWHEREIARHLDRLTALRDGPGAAFERLSAVLRAWAHIAAARRHDHGGVAAMLHRGEVVAEGHRQVLGIVRGLLADASDAGEVRRVAGPDELALVCFHAVAAARDLPSERAVDQLVDLVVAGLSARRDPSPTPVDEAS